MNKILQDLIDDVIVGTEEEEGYDEVVEEVIKRLAENVKLVKCKQKVKEVGFSEVVTGPDRIKIEEEKIKGVLDWPALQGIKDIYGAS